MYTLRLAVFSAGISLKLSLILLGNKRERVRENIWNLELREAPLESK